MRKHIMAAAAAVSLWSAVLPVSSAQADVKFSWGPYWRLRYEYWKNWKDMDNGQKDNRNYMRLKTSLWGKIDLDDSSNLFARLTNELKAHSYFGGTAGAFPDKSPTKKGYHFDISEVIFENLYWETRHLLGLPVDIRIGRQDFAGMYGEGFLIFDGTPQDGPRTLYFNAAKARWDVNDENTIDGIYINDTRDEEFLPAINKEEFVPYGPVPLCKVPQPLNTTDEQAGVAWWRNTSIEHLTLETTYIYKYEASTGGTGYQSRKSRINTIGTFAKYAMGDWTLRAQLADQHGTYGSSDRQALGGYAFLDKAIKSMPWEPSVSVGYIYLSGDDRSTTKNEGWDPPFSRWVWMSELYAMSMCAETGINGYWTNMSMYRAQLALKPSKKVNLFFWYNYLQANEQVPHTAILSGTGRDRGHLPQMKVEYLFNKNVSSHFLFEYLLPGDFYNDRDPAVFLRTEVLVKF